MADSVDPQTGQTAFDVAKQRGNARMCLMLRAHSMSEAPKATQRGARSRSVMPSLRSADGPGTMAAGWWSKAAKNAPQERTLRVRQGGGRI